MLSHLPKITQLVTCRARMNHAAFDKEGVQSITTDTTATTPPHPTPLVPVLCGDQPPSLPGCLAEGLQPVLSLSSGSPQSSIGQEDQTGFKQDVWRLKSPRWMSCSTLSLYISGSRSPETTYFLKVIQPVRSPASKPGGLDCP